MLNIMKWVLDFGVMALIKYALVSCRSACVVSSGQSIRMKGSKCKRQQTFKLDVLVAQHIRVGCQTLLVL